MTQSRTIKKDIKAIIPKLERMSSKPPVLSKNAKKKAIRERLQEKFKQRQNANVFIYLNMIVRNESKVIRRCFDSVLHLIDAIVIVDTGSDDDTIEIMNNYIKEHKLVGEIIQKPWVGGLQFDFGYNRNLALRQAEDFMQQHDPERKLNPYILIMDADNQACGPSGFGSKFLIDGSSLTLDCYDVEMRQGSTSYNYPWILKIDPDKKWKWHNPRHEYIGPDGDWSVKSAILEGGYVHSGREGCRSQNQYTYLEDTLCFLKQLKDDPKNERACFYAAQSIKDSGLGELGEQLGEVLYLYRAQMGCWDEEVYNSLLWVASSQHYKFIYYDEHKNDKYDHKNFHQKIRVEDIIELLLNAHNRSPARKEAPYYLVKIWNYQKKFRLAWSFVQGVLRTPVPSNALFADRDMEWQLIFEASLSAYYAGDKKDFIDLSKAVIAHPDADSEVKEQAQDNLNSFGK